MANEQIKQGERLEAFVGRDGEKWGEGSFIFAYNGTWNYWGSSGNANWIEVKEKNYVKSDLLVVTVVLYFIGTGLKRSQMIADKHRSRVNFARSAILFDIITKSCGKLHYQFLVEGAWWCHIINLTVNQFCTLSIGKSVDVFDCIVI